MPLLTRYNVLKDRVKGKKKGIKDIVRIIGYLISVIRFISIPSFFETYISRFQQVYYLYSILLYEIIPLQN